MTDSNQMNPTIIRRQWREFAFSKRLDRFFGDDVSLERSRMVCLKDSFKSSIWKLEIKASGQPHSIVLKVFKHRKNERPGNVIELNMYRKANRLLRESFPRIYCIRRERSTKHVWLLMDYVPSINAQAEFHPRGFDKIIPALAKLHVTTYNDKFYKNAALFDKWLPQYQSRDMKQERRQINESTLEYLDAAMKRPDLKLILNPSYELLKKTLKKGPFYFPELLKAGQCIVHNDLQMQNIGCKDYANNLQPIQFLDWESASFSPCWFDLVSLVGVMLAYRKDWAAEEEAIARHCARLYFNEMKRHDVIFQTDPLKLYKMAYIQLILDKYLYLQLSWEVNDRKRGLLLQGFLEKLHTWGRELKLY